MIGLRILTALLLCTAVVPADAARYGDRLLAEAAAQYPGIAGLRIEATAGPPLTLAWGSPAGAAHAPLRDAMGRDIGRLAVVSKGGQAVDATMLATRLSRRIYTVATLSEGDPFVPGTAAAPRAQMLVERMLDRFPDLVTLAMHVARAGGTNRIIASSFGRIGKPGDADDAHVSGDGAVLLEVTDSGRRLAVELPLHDRRGHAIGALSTSFAVPPGHDPATVAPRATAVAETLARAIPSLGWLFEPEKPERIS